MTMAEQLMNRSSTFANAISGTASSAEVPAFGSALLELASDLLGGGGEKNTKKNHEHREDGTQNQRRRSPHHRHRQFFGSSGPLFSQEPETTASFQRVQPKTREQEELEVEDEIRAFVRVPSRDDPDPTVRFRKKTYTTMPRPFECYSCMSASYQPKWAFLKEMYFAPKAFTDACDESIHRRSPIPTVLCASFCVSMLEPSVEAGVFVGFKYIRGCGDRILRHGFNQTALQIHRFAQVDKCRQLPRAHLFNQPRQLETAITGNLQLCTCYGEHCNGSSSSAAGKLAAANSALLLAFMAALISLALSRHIA